MLLICVADVGHELMQVLSGMSAYCGLQSSTHRRSGSLAKYPIVQFCSHTLLIGSANPAVQAVLHMLFYPKYPNVHTPTHR